MAEFVLAVAADTAVAALAALALAALRHAVDALVDAWAAKSPEPLVSV
jgi:hypothetical protein